ncbi:MAG: bacterioferritin-associated ferredoxin [Pantoea agglomerans]
MIICLCRGVSESDIRRVIERGAFTPDAVTAACGAGGDCGACALMLVDILAESEAVGAGARP